ncbi:MAG: hypothetical protein OEZ02_11960 [Anaerolineae bacterium]|nr:hypothetical protein [Anaerolineae bacterium]
MEKFKLSQLPLITDSPEELILSSPKSNSNTLIINVLLGIIAILFSIYFSDDLFSKDFLFTMLFFGTLFILRNYRAPETEKITIDKTRETISIDQKFKRSIFSKKSIARQFAFDQIIGIDLQASPLSLFSVYFEPPSRLQFIVKSADTELISASLSKHKTVQPGDAADEKSHPALHHKSLEIKMLDEIKSSVKSLIFIGIIHLIASGSLNFSWGIVLVGAGLASLIFKFPGIFILYAFTIFFAGVNNILVQSAAGWSFFGYYQLYLGFKIFKNSGQYRQLYDQDNLTSEGNEFPNMTLPKNIRFFPWTGLFLSSLSFLGTVLFFVIIFVSLSINASLEQSAEIAANLLFEFALVLGNLGFAFGLAGFLSNIKYKYISVLNMLMGAVAIIINIYFILN